jgi:RNA-directed DNA polymerase
MQISPPGNSNSVGGLKSLTDRVCKAQHDILVSYRKEGKYGRATCALQRKLMKSIEGRKLAFRQVITSQGRHTPGIDGVILTAGDEAEVVKKLTNFKDYKAKPVKRVTIPKANGGERHLGIPCQIDRVFQALANLALAPIVAELNCPRSYGFIKERSCRDAITAVRGTLNLKTKDKIAMSARWVVEGDIKGFFDNINHQWLMNNTPMPYKHTLLKQ